MADLQKLRNELDTDPDGRGYSSMSDEAAAVDLNIERKAKNRRSMSGAEAYGLTDPTEYTALSDAAKSQWLSLCSIISVDPFGPAAQAVIDLFPLAGTTISNLQAARVETISRAVELGIGKVTSQHVIDARAI